MTINRECVVKSLKTDYIQIGKVTAILLIMVGAGIGAFYAGLATRQYFYDLMSFLSNIVSNLFTAVNVFVVSEILITAASTFIIMVLIEEQKQLKEKSATLALILANSVCLSGVWVIYVMQSYLTSNPIPTVYAYTAPNTTYLPPYPDVLPILAIMLVINAFIVCPVVIAYARCKE